MNLNQFKPSWETIRQTPALTAGLVVFTLFLCVVRNTFGVEFSSVVLYPRSPLELNLNALSLYCLFHVNYFHWLVNMVALVTPLALYERRHGTVYTGITLNLLTVVAALQYCVLGLVLYPDTGVIGLSGIIFSFMSYMAYQEHKYKPVVETFHVAGREFKLYTLAVPVIAAFVCLVLVPGSSFFGHLAGISTGYLLGMGYIQKLFPPSSVILKIEQWVAPGISLLGPLVTYHREEDATNVRSVQYTPLFSQDVESSGVSRDAPPTSRSSSYVSETRILGQA
ncbi:uncharacterized protein LODBEIA_P59660 [Lodderomyces beijingensis]|uniref:Rhomboid-type serine protease 2 n=1 Tax=Lodderomyces beijingensis TaxID=1775926 RepID=A0ABP0ZUD5_9ASCO